MMLTTRLLPQIQVAPPDVCLAPPAGDVTDDEAAASDAVIHSVSPFAYPPTVQVTPANADTIKRADRHRQKVLADVAGMNQWWHCTGLGPRLRQHVASLWKDLQGLGYSPESAPPDISLYGTPQLKKAVVRGMWAEDIASWVGQQFPTKV